MSSQVTKWFSVCGCVKFSPTKWSIWISHWSRSNSRFMETCQSLLVKESLGFGSSDLKLKYWSQLFYNEKFEPGTSFLRTWYFAIPRIVPTAQQILAFVLTWQSFEKFLQQSWMRIKSEVNFFYCSTFHRRKRFCHCTSHAEKWRRSRLMKWAFEYYLYVL